MKLVVRHYLLFLSHLLNCQLLIDFVKVLSCFPPFLYMYDVLQCCATFVECLVPHCLQLLHFSVTFLPVSIIIYAIATELLILLGIWDRRKTHSLFALILKHHPSNDLDGLPFSFRVMVGFLYSPANLQLIPSGLLCFLKRQVNLPYFTHLHLHTVEHSFMVEILWKLQNIASTEEWRLCHSHHVR